MSILGINTTDDYWTIQANTITGSKFTCPATGTLTDIYININGVGDTYNYRLGVYEDDSGNPAGKLLDAGAVTITGAGWYYIDGLSLSITNETVYWLVALGEGAANTRALNNQGASSTVENAQAYGALPSTFTLDSPTYRTWKWEMYGNITVGGAAPSNVVYMIFES